MSASSPRAITIDREHLHLRSSCSGVSEATSDVRTGDRVRIGCVPDSSPTHHTWWDSQHNPSTLGSGQPLTAMRPAGVTSTPSPIKRNTMIGPGIVPSVLFVWAPGQVCGATRGRHAGEVRRRLYCPFLPFMPFGGPRWMCLHSTASRSGRRVGHHHRTRSWKRGVLRVVLKPHSSQSADATATSLGFADGDNASKLMDGRCEDDHGAAKLEL